MARLYSRIIFPWLCELVMSRAVPERLRRETLARALGDVLEIGFGTGLNLPFYPTPVRSLTVVDPNAGMHHLARRRIKRARFPVHAHQLGGERLPFADAQFDCVVSTFTLCSIDAVDQAMAEAYRVLKPGGLFLFLEHGLSPEPKVQVWQRRLNWLEMRLADGCRLDREMKEIVAVQPFTSVQVEEFQMDHAPRTHGYLYRGVAIK